MIHTQAYLSDKAREALDRSIRNRRDLPKWQAYEAAKRLLTEACDTLEEYDLAVKAYRDRAQI